MTEVMTKKMAAAMRDGLAKTARLLVKDGIRVTMQGSTPLVEYKNGKISRLNLPPLPDDADPKLLVAMQGYLDHEVAHIHFTDWPATERIQRYERRLASMVNLIEDIRIEKLIPEMFPGSKLNLERMRRGVFYETLNGHAKKAILSGNKTSIILAMIVPGFRALSGQVEMQELMTDNGYWPFLQPIIDIVPDLEQRLKDLETHADVESLARLVMDTIKMDIETPRDAPDDDDDDDGDSDSDSDDDGGAASMPMGGDDEPGDSSDEGDEGDSADAGDGPDAGDENSEDGDASDSDAGDSDAGDTDTSEGDAGEAGAEGDASSEGADDIDGGPGSDSSAGEGDENDGDSDPSDESNDGESSKKSSGKGETEGNITHAMQQLDATSRRVLFMYKKDKKSVAEIAGELKLSEESVADILRNARRKLPKIMKGTADE